MITIKHRVTSERQFVSALDGIDLEVWEETAEAVPDDLATTVYVVIDGALGPAPEPERRLSRTEFLDLWTPAETVAVTRTTDDLMAWFWARALAWEDGFLLSDPRVIAGVTKARSVEILTEARAARILAGLPPE